MSGGTGNLDLTIAGFPVGGLLNLTFYGNVDGNLVWLCWRYGEESLRYWHSLESGYSSRKPLRAEARQRLWN